MYSSHLWLGFAALLSAVGVVTLIIGVRVQLRARHEMARQRAVTDDEAVPTGALPDWRKQQLQALLAEIDNRVLRQQPLEESIHRMCARLRVLLGCRQVWMALADNDGSLRVTAWAGAGAGATAAGGGIGQRLDAAAEPWAQVMASNVTWLDRSAALFPPFVPEPDQEENIGWVALVPLSEQDRPLGVLGLGARRAFDAVTMAALEEFARRMAFSLLAARRQQQVHLLTAALESAANGIMITDRQAVIQWVNGAFTTLTGYAAEEVVGRTPRILQSGRHDQAFYRNLWQTILTGKVWRGEIYNRRKDGSIYLEEHVITGVRSAEGTITHFVDIKQDVTRRKQLEDALREAEAKYRSIFEGAVVGIYQVNSEGRVVTANAMLARILGYDSAEQLIAELVVPETYVDKDRRAELLQRLQEDGAVTGFEAEYYRRDGSTVWVSLNARPLLDAAGRISGTEGSMVDITERKQAETRLLHLATHDYLTDLPNRYALEESLKRAVARARRGQQGALVVLDLDNFKLVNDTAGHAVGDRLLVEIAGLMARTLRECDVLARLGGDEFAVLLEDTDDREAAVIAVRLQQALDGFRFSWQNEVYAVTASIGIATIDGALNAGAVLALADAALYAAKEQGRNRVVFYHSEKDREGDLTETGRWVRRIKDAQREGRLALVFQPVVHLADEQPIYYEVLLRMHGENGEVILPGSFIPVAERFGLMPELDRWMIRAAIDTLARRPQLRLFINLSAASVTDEGVLAFLQRCLMETPAAGGRLGIEITETTAVRDLVEARTWMNRLRTLGCRFALDDMGMGFSSLTYLRDLPVDYVKIDGSLIRTLDTDATQRTLVQAVTMVAHALNKKVIAEWVETEATRDTLLEIGVDMAQGHLWGPPGALVDDAAG